MEEKFYTVQEVAEMLKVTGHSVRRWIANRQLQCVKAGNTVRILQSQIDAFLKPTRSEE